jgi:polyhydroxybutyrate depolymerase
MPLVVALHGGGGSASGFARYTGLQDLADEMGFIVVFPQGLNNRWYDSIHLSREPEMEWVDDTGFIAALVESVGRAHSTGPVFVMGLSNGGMFVQELLVTRGDLFSGGASVVSQMPAGFAGHTSNPVPVLFMNGTLDPLVPYGGGTVTLPWGETRGEVLSTNESVALWLGWNGIGCEPELTFLPDTDPEDGATAVLSEWSKDGRVVVALCTIEGGGHTLPGGRQYLPPRIVGNTCRDLDGSRAILEFFLGL